MTAKLEKTITNWNGHAALYKLDPPTADTTYVVVSAVNVVFSGPETYIFPANKNGTVTSWSELNGSYKGGLDHAEALKRAGYDLR